MMERFNVLTLREKIMVLLMLALIGLFILWQFILAPLGRYHNIRSGVIITAPSKPRSKRKMTGSLPSKILAALILMPTQRAAKLSPVRF